MYLNNFDPINAVFDNEIILDKILNNVSKYVFPLIPLRLIKKSFNEAVLHKIRKDHREVVLHTAYHCDVADEYTEYMGTDYECRYCYIYLNYQKVTSNKMSSFFRFLKDTVAVKIVKLILEPARGFPFSHFCLNNDLLFHNIIMNDLIGNNYKSILHFEGMIDICLHGCFDCMRIMLNCEVYGPAQINVIRRKEPKHFKELELPEVMADLPDDPPNMEFKVGIENWEMESIKKTKISCDKLILRLSHSAVPNPRIWYYKYITREVIDIIISNWKVKTVKLIITINNMEEFITIPEQFHLFTKERLGDPISTHPISKNSLEKVELDLRFGVNTLVKMFHRSAEILPTDNIIENVRRIFPTKNMIITLPNSFSPLPVEHHCRFVMMFLRMGFPKGQRNFNVTWRLFIHEPIYGTSPGFKYRNMVIPAFNYKPKPWEYESSLQNNHLYFEKTVKLQDEQEFSFFKEVKIWKGNKFCVRNAYTNCNVDIDLYFESNLLKKVLNTLNKIESQSIN